MNFEDLRRASRFGDKLIVTRDTDKEEKFIVTKVDTDSIKTISVTQMIEWFDKGLYNINRVRLYRDGVLLIDFKKKINIKLEPYSVDGKFLFLDSDHNSYYRDVSGKVFKTKFCPKVHLIHQLPFVGYCIDSETYEKVN